MVGGAGPEPVAGERLRAGQEPEIRHAAPSGGGSPSSRRSSNCSRGFRPPAEPPPRTAPPCNGTRLRLSWRQPMQHCFPPVTRPDTRLLVLGSLPGAVSLAEGRYYAHPQNQFWRLIGAVIDRDLAGLDYEARLRGVARCAGRPVGHGRRRHPQGEPRRRHPPPRSERPRRAGRLAAAPEGDRLQRRHLGADRPPAARGAFPASPSSTCLRAARLMPASPSRRSAKPGWPCAPISECRNRGSAPRIRAGR